LRSDFATQASTQLQLVAFFEETGLLVSSRKTPTANIADLLGVQVVPRDDSAAHAAIVQQGFAGFSGKTFFWPCNTHMRMIVAAGFIGLRAIFIFIRVRILLLNLINRIDDELGCDKRHASSSLALEKNGSKKNIFSSRNCQGQDFHRARQMPLSKISRSGNF